jgi:phosphoenolpyruvate carboxykinase (ATP)
MPIKATRALLNAALSGSLANAEMRFDELFGFQVPRALDGVDPKILTPRQTWADPAEYDRTAQNLAQMFIANFEKFAEHVDDEVMAAGPSNGSRAAAE